MSYNPGAACGEDCGWCGACTKADGQRDDSQPEYCIQCGLLVERVSIAVFMANHIAAACCSQHCYDEFRAHKSEAGAA